MKKVRGRTVPESYSELCEMWDGYYSTNGKYPNSLICKDDFNLPAWSRVKTICGERFEEFCIKYGVGRLKDKSYEYYCDRILNLATELGRSPTIKDIRNFLKDVPDTRWLVKHCPNENVSNYNDFLLYLNLKPSYFINKEMATKLILEKRNKLGRNLKIEDFQRVSINEVGIATIVRLWGSFNEMLIALGLGINQIGRGTIKRNINELENDIIALCDNLSKTRNHKIISVDDIESCEWCQSYGTYNRRFKLEKNVTLSEFIRNLGYDINESGVGMNYTFEDGELTTSKYEYELSNYLRNKNIQYLRNVKYNTFIDGYYGNKDCDYLIYINGVEYYVEVAGMLRDARSLTHASKLKLNTIHKLYLKNLKEKERMLRSSGLNYLILFPYDLNNKIEELIAHYDLRDHAEEKNGIFSNMNNK